MKPMKPLYRYAGGKTRVLQTYLPFFQRLRPEHCVDYFGGSGTMSLWFHQLYPDAKLYLNERDAAIYKLFMSVKEDYDLFIGLVKDIDYEYRYVPGTAKRKAHYYTIRNKHYNPTQYVPREEADYEQWYRRYLGFFTEKEIEKVREMYGNKRHSQEYVQFIHGKNTALEHASYFFLRTLSFSGINTRNSKGEYTASSGVRSRNGAPPPNPSFYDPEALAAFKAMLDHATLSNADYKALELQLPKSLHYFDPPYVDASDHLYTSSFGWEETEALCTTLQRVSEHSTVFMSNFDHPKLKRLMQGFDWYAFPMQGGLYNKRKNTQTRPREILFYKIHPSIQG